MTTELKHYNWRGDGHGGRIAVRVQDNRFELRALAGSSPPPEILGALFDEMGLWDRAHELHRERSERFAVEHRTGMSGCEDWKLRSEHDASWGDFPIEARLHISMYGKLNDGFKAGLGDCIPLFAAAGIGAAEELTVSLWEAVIFSPDRGWDKAPSANPEDDIEIIRVVRPDDPVTAGGPVAINTGGNV